MKSDRGPVFIGGMNGSGTTMLLDYLNSHSMLYGFPVETRIIPYEILNAGKHGDLNDDGNFYKLWEHICGLFPFRKTNGNQPMAIPEDWASVDRNVAAVFDHIFRLYAASEGKSRWCEKSPRNILNITLLANVFPDAKFIHVIRDGRDCAASFHRRWKYQPERSIQRWKHLIQQGRQQGSLIGERYLEVYYEDITERPFEEFEKITDFLGIAFEENMLVTDRKRKMTGNSATKISVNNRNFKAYFSSGQIIKLDKIAGKMLHELGYPTSAVNGDQDLSQLKEKIYKFKEMLWYVFLELKHKYKSKGRRPWSMVFGRFQNALKQYAVNRGKE